MKIEVKDPKYHCDTCANCMGSHCAPTENVMWAAFYKPDFNEELMGLLYRTKEKAEAALREEVLRIRGPWDPEEGYDTEESMIESWIDVNGAVVKAITVAE